MSLNDLLFELLRSPSDPVRISAYVPITDAFSLQRQLWEMRLNVRALLNKSKVKDLLDFEIWLDYVALKLRRLEKGMSVAIFYSKNVRKFIPLEVDLPLRVVVSKSFHLKPLAFAVQAEADGWIFELKPAALTVSRILGSNAYAYETFKLPGAECSYQAQRIKEISDSMALLNRKPLPVFVTGELQVLTRSESFWSQSFDEVYIDSNYMLNSDNQSTIRRFQEQLKNRKSISLQKEIQTLSHLPNCILGPENVFEGILRESVSRVYVSLEATQWGILRRLDQRIERISDQGTCDDLLDDLAELAYKKKIPVRVFRQSSLPSGKVILAS